MRVSERMKIQTL